MASSLGLDSLSFLFYEYPFFCQLFVPSSPGGKGNCGTRPLNRSPSKRVDQDTGEWNAAVAWAVVWVDSGSPGLDVFRTLKDELLNTVRLNEAYEELECLASAEYARASGSGKPREWPNEDFTINLLGGLTCKLFGTARNLDASYTSIEVVDRSGSGLPRFRKNLVFGDTPMVSFTHSLLIIRMTNFSIMRWTVQRKAGRGMWVMDTKGGMINPVDGMMVFQTNYLHIDGKDKTLVLVELLHTDMSCLAFFSSFSYISHQLSRMSKESDVSGLGCHIAPRNLTPKCSMTDKDLALINAFCLNFNGKK
eukprot:gene30720-35749_t